VRAEVQADRKGRKRQKRSADDDGGGVGGGGISAQIGERWRALTEGERMAYELQEDALRRAAGFADSEEEVEEGGDGDVPKLSRAAKRRRAGE
jgi:hypothetical protein